ncbi:MAG: RNA polymerase sigma factor [Thermoanaerobaculaceae bacterium]|nr:RNA polymerase sigma factor [Thermoanaerobaculaceae bacterium]
MTEAGAALWGWTIRTPTEPAGATSTRTALATPATGEGVVARHGFAVAVDELLLARAKRGERAALEQLFRLFEAPLYTLARRLCRSVEDAEDVVQEAMLEVFRSLASFRGEGSFAGWVRRIAVSKALMKLRAEKPARSEPLDEAALAPVAPEQEQSTVRLDLEATLATLPAAARAVVWLHEVEGLSHEEIGALWGKSASFSKSQLARAYARLRVLVARGKGGACT